MVKPVPGQRRVALGLGLIVLGIVGVVAAMPVSAGTRAPTQTSEPIVVPGNPTCGDLAPAGAEWTELKVDPVTGGEHTDGTLTVTLTVHENEDTGPTLDWTSNIGVDAVFVKGGDNGSLYLYNPESMGATGLHAPINPQNGKYFGLSHVSFCYDEDNGTTTTSEATTTTTAAPTTTVGPPPTPAPQPPASTPPGPRPQLPVTGRQTTPMLVGGGILLIAGIALLAGSRRLRRT